MGFAEEFEKISRTEARSAAARFIYTEIRDWRSTKKRVASRRWLWELLQNARDCSNGKPFSFKVTWKPSELIIKHDAGPFLLREIVALVEGDSSKQRKSPQTTGRFGKGFLVTHVISTEVRVRGVLKDHEGRLFNSTFLLSRGGSEGEIRENIGRCANALDNTLPFQGGRCETQFIYYVSPKDESRLYIDEALRALRQHSPYLFAFIPELTAVSFSIGSEPDAAFRALPPAPVPPGQVPARGQRVVVQTPEGNREVLTFAPSVEARQEVGGNGLRIAFEILKKGEREELHTPITSPVAKIFQDLPLYGTSDLEIPIVINLPRTAEVDSHRSEPDLADQETRSAVMDALRLLPALVEWAREQNVGSIHYLGELGVSKELEKDEVKQGQWRDITAPILRQLLTCKIVQTAGGLFVRPEEAIFPDDKWLDSTGSDPDLLRGTRDLLQKRGDRVPKSEIVQEWETIICKWKSIEPSIRLRLVSLKDLFRELEDRKRLAALSGGHEVMGTESSALEYVCEVFRVAREYCERHRISAPSDLQESAVIPNQRGEFCLPRDLSLDGGIDETLKSLSEDLAIPFRKRLIHLALANSAGKKLVAQLCGERVMTTTAAVAELISALEKRVSEPLRGSEAERTKRGAVVSVVWLAAHEDVAAQFDLAPFPLLCLDGKLRAIADFHEPFILPATWLTDDERKWLGLFPESIRLSDEYASVCRSLGMEPARLASLLCGKKLANASLLVKREAEIKSDFIAPLLPPTAVKSGHMITKVEATDVTGLTRLLSETASIVSSSGSPGQAARVLEFVLQYLVTRDIAWKTSVEVPCLSKQPHQCNGIVSLYPCEWLAKLKTHRWVPSEESGTSCESLNPRNAGMLLADMPVEIFKYSEVREFLALHCGLNPLELAIRAAAGGDPGREAILRNQWAAIIETVQPSEVQDFVARQRRASETNSRNERIGRIVEKLAIQAFKAAGFIDIEPTGIGSDFRAAIAPASDPILEEHDIGVLELRPRWQGRSLGFLVEVKATQGDSVRMSWLQAGKAASNSDSYVLCVVDFSSCPERLDLILKENDPSPDLIKDCIRVAPRIGLSLVEPVQNLSSAVQTTDPAVEVEKADELRFRILRSVWVNGHMLQEWAQSVRDQLAKAQPV